MTFTHPKGKHRAGPIYWLRWWPLLIGRRSISRKVRFYFTAKYDHPGIYDDEDVNKLFGISFLRPHRNSARYGWRYDPMLEKVILSAYCYINGERHIIDLCRAYFNKNYECEIIITDSHYLFRVTYDYEIVAEQMISKGHNKKLGWLLGPYFGGNNPAPHTFTFQLSKI